HGPFSCSNGPTVDFSVVDNGVAVNWSHQTGGLGSRRALRTCACLAPNGATGLANSPGTLAARYRVLLDDCLNTILRENISEPVVCRDSPKQAGPAFSILSELSDDLGCGHRVDGPRSGSGCAGDQSGRTPAYARTADRQSRAANPGRPEPGQTQGKPAQRGDGVRSHAQSVDGGR